MRPFLRTLARCFVPISVAFVAVAAALTFESLPNPDQGMRLGYQGGQIVVVSVEYGSAAGISGLWPGAVVEWLDGENVLLSSDQVKRKVAESSGPWTSIVTVRRDDAAAWEAIDRQALEFKSIDTPYWPNAYHYQLTILRSFDPLPVAVGLAVLILGWWWVGSGRAGTTLRPYALTLPVATAVPLLVLPIDRYPSGLAAVSAAFLVLLAMMPLAIDLVGRVEGRAGRRLAAAIASALAAGSALAGLSIPTSQGLGQLHYILQSVLMLGPLLMLPVAFVYLWRTERGRRRWLIALAGLGLAVGSIQVGNLIPSVPSFDAPHITVAGISVLPDPSQWYLLHSMLANGWIFAPLVMLPLAVVTLQRLAGPRKRWLVLILLIALAVGLTAAAIYLPYTSEMRLWRAALAGGVVFVTGLLVVRPWHRPGSGETVGSGPTTRSLIESLDIVMAAVTPGIACIGLVFAHSMVVWPILLWLALLLIATRFTLRPLARLAARAARERDLVVAATEAERMRIAADIHDDALQDLTMLVRRLDSAGDTENAQAAREIAERLRAICGDLRLPVLDDLGVGPALEWLCGRLAPATEEISLDRLDLESRLPGDVELAVFRVAQEALSNAVRHGAAPVVVRYRAREGWVELEVDDSGAGIAEGAAELAAQTGHLGLLTMTQRAEAVGARLSIRRRPGGGTRVSFIWERATAPAGAVAATAPA